MFDFYRQKNAGRQVPRKTLRAYIGTDTFTINRARLAAGWKRNFSLLRHILYHNKNALSIVFSNFLKKDFSIGKRSTTTFRRIYKINKKTYDKQGQNSQRYTFHQKIRRKIVQNGYLQIRAGSV